MLLIATDEAGYGPKLGPLTIVATAWFIPDDYQSDQELSKVFEPLATTTKIDDQSVVVNDSKAIFQPGKTNPLAKLHAAISTGNQWCEQLDDAERLIDLLRQIASDDMPSIDATAWLKPFEQEPSFLPATATSEAIQKWSSTGIRFLGVVARVITAAEFNLICQNGVNKSDLLSQSTLALLKSLLDAHSANSSRAHVYCDRHGGRRYYAGVLQHLFDESMVMIDSETKERSSYRLKQNDVQTSVHFSVKGDRFTPVAMSSLYAKYIRERMMDRFNAYFESKHIGKHAYVPTAGYPTDAERFLKVEAATIKKLKIESQQLIRNR